MSKKIKKTFSVLLGNEDYLIALMDKIKFVEISFILFFISFIDFGS